MDNTNELNTKIKSKKYVKIVKEKKFKIIGKQ